MGWQECFLLDVEGLVCMRLSTFSPLRSILSELEWVVVGSDH
jgi:hypothetical protein